VRLKYNISGIAPVFPLGIAYLGAVLEQQGTGVRLLDMTLPEHARFDFSRDLPPDLRFIGLSATLFSIGAAIELSAAIKRARPMLPVVLGGPVNVFEPDVLARRFPHVDVFAFEEGETTVRRLADADFTPAHLASIPAIGYREDGRLVCTPRNSYADLNNLPLPARHLLPRGRYTMHPPFGRFSPVTVMETARGCPYRCAFCALPRTLRQRSPEHVLDEIRHLVKNEGVREIHFIDPTFTADPERIAKLCELLRTEPYRLHWTFKTRADLVSLPLLKRCREAGCYMISYGIESLSDQALTSLDKGYTGGDAVRALRDTHAAGIRTLIYMLLGNPGDTNESVRRTTTTLRRLRGDYALFSGVFPAPGAAMFKDLDRAAFTPADVESFYFDGPSTWDFESLTGIPSRQIRRWVWSSYLRFYLHPAYLARQAIRVENWRDFRRVASGLWHLAKDFFDRRLVN
jgi:radical SAM superfamily enzyme YgiQ (UPF0313 family)